MKMNELAKPVSTWRKVVAAIPDFLTIFLVGGFVVAYLSGGLTGDGFDLSGGPALILFAVIIAYFIVGRKFAGGTMWQCILRA
jgi:hypothetical protein